MTVELASARKSSISQQVTVVGNLIGEATVSVAPRTAGRLQSVTVKLGDRVSRGQRIAQIEDFDIQEQVKQAVAAAEVSAATIRQREADLKRSETNLERSKSLFERQLLPRQTLDDNEATLPGGRRPARSGARAERAVEGAARRAEDHARQHDHHLAGHRLRLETHGRSRRLRRRRTPRSWKSSTSAPSGWSPTSSRRTCGS